MSTTVFIYNNDLNQMEIYYLENTDTMPYANEGTLTVDEFRGSSASPTLWTDKGVMDCWNLLRQQWGSPIGVQYAFKRIWQGTHGPQSQHYAGTAMDMAQKLTSAQRNKLRNLAKEIGCWVYVEPAYLTPTWVHVDKRMTPSACSAGFIEVAEGSVNTYVLVLQDALNTLGFTGAGLDGIYGQGTKKMVMEYQRSRGLAADGVVGCLTWTYITKEVVGTGKTATTLV